MIKKIRPDHIKLKRAYEPPAPDDGTRILIDRLWPRGVKKADAAIDEWMKEIAPSTGLRKWFGHDPSRWQEFRPPLPKREPADSRPAYESRAAAFLISARESDFQHVHGAGTSEPKRGCIASLPRSRSAALRTADGPVVRLSARAMLRCWTHLTRGSRRLT